MFSFEFGADGICPNCKYQDGECQCPGPHSETEDGEAFDFKTIKGVMHARPPEGYGWDGNKSEQP